MHVEIIDTYIPVYSYSYAVIKDQMKDKLQYGIQHNLTKRKSVGLCSILCFSHHFSTLHHIILPPFLSRYYSYSLISHITTKNTLNVAIVSLNDRS